MPTKTALIQHIPQPFTPDDPDSLYLAFMALYEKSADRFSDPSQFYSEAWCAYLRERGSKTTDQRALELRWMAHEWRRRACKPMERVSEAWDNTIPAMAHPEARPMREIPIKRPETRDRSRPKGDPAYAQLPALYAQGLTANEIAQVIGKERGAVAKAITRGVRSGKLKVRT